MLIQENTQPNWCCILRAWVLCICFLCIYSERAVSGRRINWTYTTVWPEIYNLFVWCKAAIWASGVKPFKICYPKNRPQLWMQIPMMLTENWMHVNSLKLNGSLMFLVIQILSVWRKWPKSLFQWTKWFLLENKPAEILLCFCLVKLQGSKVKHALLIVSYLLFTWMLEEQFERVPICYFVNV